MKTMKLMLLLPLAALVLGGCADGFENEEMQLGTQDKVRPLGIFCEPAEAAPGDTVTVTLNWHDPRPDETTISWRVALDYDSGLYASDPVERDFVDLDPIVAEPVDAGEGFMSQTFSYVLPASILVRCTAIPEDLETSLIGDLAEAMLPGAASGLTKAEVDAFLAALTPADLALLDADERRAVWALADLFTCAIRFRARLETDLRLDVTRNLTVRHSRRLQSPNVNTNAAVTGFDLVGVAATDFDHDDLDTFGGEVQRHSLLAGGVTVERRPGWTWFLETDVEPQQYTSPFSGDQLFTEAEEYRWYSFRRDDGDATWAFFRDEEGEECEMYELDDWVRIEPPGVDEARFSVSIVVRDERGEWEGFHGSPGATLQRAEIVFQAPAE